MFNIAHYLITLNFCFCYLTVTFHFLFTSHLITKPITLHNIFCIVNKKSVPNSVHELSFILPHMQRTRFYIPITGYEYTFLLPHIYARGTSHYSVDSVRIPFLLLDFWMRSHHGEHLFRPCKEEIGGTCSSCKGISSSTILLQGC